MNRCAHCGRARKAPDLLYSRHTGQRYCATDLAKCEAGGRKRIRQAKKAAAITATLVALVAASSAQARQMLPEKVNAGDPAWRVEQKQLKNLAYARRYVRHRQHGPDPAPQALRWYRRAARWIVREHAELQARTIGPWLPTYRCEHGRGGWASNTGNGYFGGVQFDMQTWQSHGGWQFSFLPSEATPIQQVTVAWRLDYDGWPRCPNP